MTPVVSFFDAACAGAVTTDPLTGAVTINPGPYSAPAAAEHPMAQAGDEFWAQSQPGTGVPPPYVCVKDATARNAAGQTVPAYYLGKVSDLVTITDSWYDGSANATLTVKAVSSDPTAVLTLEAYGLSSGTAGPLAATVSALVAPTGQGSGYFDQGRSHPACGRDAAWRRAAGWRPDGGQRFHDDHGRLLARRGYLVRSRSGV